MPANSLNEELLNQLGEDFSARYRRGENPTVSEYTTRFTGDEAKEVEEFLDSIVMLEQLKQEEQPSSSSPDTPPEDFGRYRIERCLGEGGMGAVYLAHDAQLDRKVALKTPKFSGSSDQNLMKRFYREARSAATLQHPNICPVYDVGEINGIHYISMAYVDGRPLSDFVESKKLPPVASVLRVIRKVAIALHEAHSQGLIHRDLKPANIMIDRRNEPIVMDFGLARQFGAENSDSVEVSSTDGLAALAQARQIEARLTMDGTIMGSPGYMAPEQLRGDHAMIGPASDVYALGVVMYELLTRQLPFPGDGTLMSMVNAAMADAPPDASAIRPNLDSKVAALCCKAMAKQPGDRFESMHAFAVALTGLLKTDGADGGKHAVTGVVNPSASPRLVRAKEQYELARSLYQDGQFSAAASIMEKMLEGGEKPTNQYTKWAASRLEKTRARAADSAAVENTEDEFWAEAFDTVGSGAALPPRTRKSRRRREKSRRHLIVTFLAGAGGAAALLVAAIALRNSNRSDAANRQLASDSPPAVSPDESGETEPDTEAAAVPKNDTNDPDRSSTRPSGTSFAGRPRNNTQRQTGNVVRKAMFDRMMRFDRNNDDKLSKAELRTADFPQGAAFSRVVDEFDTFDVSPTDGFLEAREIQRIITEVGRSLQNGQQGAGNRRMGPGRGRRRTDSDESGS